MSTTVATQEQANPFAVAEKKPKDIKSLLEGDDFKRAVAKALPAHCTPDRFIRTALTATMRTPKLLQCDRASFFNALMNLSQWGLEPDGRRAHLIPFENRKRGVTEVQLIIDYKGLVELALRSGTVSYVHADIVCENDEFEYDKGELKKHKINFREDRGKMYAVYALCRFKDGNEKCEVMTKSEVDGIRARSRAGQAGPWTTDFNEMAKKTVFRRLSKWLNLSAEFRDATEADADSLEDTRIAGMKQAQVAVAPEGLDGVLAEMQETAAIEAGEPEPPADPTPEPEQPAATTPAPTAGAPSILDQLKDAMKEDGVTEVEITAWCRAKKLANERQTINQLSEAKLKEILAGWPVVEAEIKQGRK